MKLYYLFFALLLSSCGFYYQPRAQTAVKAYFIKNLRHPASYQPGKFYGLSPYEEEVIDSQTFNKTIFKGWMMAHTYKAKDEHGNLNTSAKTFILTSSCDSVIRSF